MSEFYHQQNFRLGTALHSRSFESNAASAVAQVQRVSFAAKVTLVTVACALVAGALAWRAHVNSREDSAVPAAGPRNRGPPALAPAILECLLDESRTLSSIQ